jgi:hypothetical protein
MSDVLRFLTSSGTTKMDSVQAVNDAQTRLKVLEDEVSRTEKKISDLRTLASKWTKRKMFLGSSIPIAQFATIFYGTFELYSWDIMEPICYLMTFSNFTLGFAFYVLNHRELELTSLHEMLTERNVRKRCARNGIDLNKHKKN